MLSLTRKLFLVSASIQLLTAVLIGATSYWRCMVMFGGAWFEVVRIGVIFVLLLPTTWYLCLTVARTVDAEIAGEIATAVDRATNELDRALRLATEYVHLRTDLSSEKLVNGAYVGDAASQQHSGIAGGDCCADGSAASCR